MGDAELLPNPEGEALRQPTRLRVRDAQPAAELVTELLVPVRGEGEVKGD